jgi:hypothetical protein
VLDPDAVHDLFSCCPSTSSFYRRRRRTMYAAYPPLQLSARLRRPPAWHRHSLPTERSFPSFRRPTFPLGRPRRIRRCRKPKRRPRCSFCLVFLSFHPWRGLLMSLHPPHPPSLLSIPDETSFKKQSHK